MDDPTINEQEAFDALADAVADRVVAKLAGLMTFPTAEDVERIRDHIDPNGIAYRNGFKAGREGFTELKEQADELWTCFAKSDMTGINEAIYVMRELHRKYAAR